MRRNNVIFILAVLLSFAVTYGLYMWYMNTLRKGPHTVNELVDNSANQLNLRVQMKPDFMKICDQFAIMSKEQLEDWLQQPDRELNEVSFALHYLGNRYLSLDSFEKGIWYLEKSAEFYLNPFSYLKLGQIYTNTKEEVLSKLSVQDIKFQQDLKKAYLNLRIAYVTAEASMHGQGDNYVFNFVNRYSDGALSNWKEAQKKSQFNMETELESLASVLDEKQAAYEALYRIKKDK